MINPSLQSRLINTAPSPSSMTTDNDTSTTPNARNSHNLSVSDVTRVIKLPVVFREKKLKLSDYKCSNRSLLRSRATNSPSTDIMRKRTNALAWRTRYTMAIVATAIHATVAPAPTVSVPS